MLLSEIQCKIKSQLSLCSKIPKMMLMIVLFLHGFQMVRYTKTF